MEAINVNALMNDPLAGCSIYRYDVSDKSTLSDSIVRRIGIFRSVLECELMLYKVCSEVTGIAIDGWEYRINELLYEFRLAKGTTDEYEADVLNKWIAKVISKHGEDTGLEFYKVVTVNRKKRRR